MTSNLLTSLTLTRNKAAGSAEESVLIRIPQEAGAIRYGAATENAVAVSHNLSCNVTLNNGVINVNQFTGNLYTLTAIGCAATTTRDFGGNFMRWRVQANAGTLTEFALLLSFLRS